MKKVLSKWKNALVKNTFIKSHGDLEIEIGDSKNELFYPQVKIKKWDNEVNFSARIVHREVDPVVINKGNSILFDGKNLSVDFYEIKNSEEFPEGGVEFDITLRKRPEENIIWFTLQTKGLEFFYQGEISDEEAKEEAEIRGCSIEEARRFMRPENVVGSYAVYYKDVPLNIIGGKDYKVGKVMHIYRPRIMDADGKWVWGILRIDEEKGLMSVEIPWEFLDRAVYPVRHAAGATFGYTSGGASSASTTNSAGSKFSMNAENGVLQKISCYIRASTGTMDVYAALYSDNAGAPNALLSQQSSATTGVGTTPGFVDVNMNSYNLVASTAYWLWEGASSSTKVIYWDGGAANQYNIQGMGNPPTWTNPITPGTYFARKLSIYATYSTDITTTQTITGKGRIGVNVSKTVLGKSRVQIVSSQNLSGKSRINVSSNKVVSGKGRIRKLINSTIQGKGDIIDLNSQDINGKGRIQKIVNGVIVGKGRVGVSVLKIIVGKGRVGKTSNQSIDGVSRVKTAQNRMIEGVGRISVVGSGEILGKGRIRIVVGKIIEGLSRIISVVGREISGKGKIEGSNSQSIDGKGRISELGIQNISGISKISGGVSRNISGKGSISGSVERSISGRGKIVVGIPRRVVIGLNKNSVQVGVANVGVRSVSVSKDSVTVGVAVERKSVGVDKGSVNVGVEIL